MMETKNIAYMICAILVGYLLIGIAPGTISKFAATNIPETDRESGLLGVEGFDQNDTDVEEEGESADSQEDSSELKSASGDQLDETVTGTRFHPLSAQTVLFWVADFIVAFTIYFVARRHFS